MQVLCLPPTILNLSMNAFAHSFFGFNAVFISLKTFFLSITSTQIYILEVIYSHIADHNCTLDICIVYFTLFYFIILITYTIGFMTYFFICICITHLLSILIVPHHCFNCILCNVLLFFNIVFYVYICTLSEINMM